MQQILKDNEAHQIKVNQINQNIVNNVEQLKKKQEMIDSKLQQLRIHFYLKDSQLQQQQ